MKKLFAILMVFVILFNTGGYELFFQYLIYQSDSGIIEKINHNGYRKSDLVDVKIPVNMPTQQDFDGYRAISGQVEIKGHWYDYAEIRITKDTLFLHVVPNTERNNIAKAKIQYGKQVNDIPASNSKRSNNSFAKKSLSESVLIAFNSIPSPQKEITKSYLSFTISNISKPALEVGGQPPEA